MKKWEVLEILKCDAVIIEFYDYDKHKREVTLMKREDVYRLHWKTFESLMINKEIYMTDMMSTVMPNTETLIYKIDNKEKVMNCKCEKFEGSTTIMCCNNCKLPLKTEPWSIPEPSVKTVNLDALVREKIAKAIKFAQEQADNYVNATKGNEDKGYDYSGGEKYGMVKGLKLAEHIISNFTA